MWLTFIIVFYASIISIILIVKFSVRDMISTEDRIKNLKDLLSNIDTEAMLGAISLSYYTFTDGDGVINNEIPFQFGSELMSPHKQRLYLAGLLMSTDQIKAHDVGTEIKKIEKLVQDITSTYVRGFLPIERLNIKSEEFKEKMKKNIVSMDAFVSYFDTGVLRYEEQTYELIKILYSEFDNELYTMTGLSISDYLNFYQFCKDELEYENENMMNAEESLKTFFESLSASNESIEIKYQKLLSYSTDYPAQIKAMQDGFVGLNKIYKDSILKRFGTDKANKIISYFTLERKNREYIYYNQENPFAKKPLCWLDDRTLFLVSPQILINAIYDHITETLEKTTNVFAEKYKKKKAQIVENEFRKCFQLVLGDKARYHCSVCESIGTQEHDIVIEYNNVIIIAEVKASKVHEPFFNAEKAYERIERHFNSKSGIGYAYKQAIRLKKKLKSNDEIVLFENMKEQFILSNLSFKTIIPVVLTLEQFGGISINTSPLLHPDEGEPYPWVCNLHDFQNLIEMLNYLNKCSDDFIGYIVWRSVNHAHILASDELDIAEWYFANPTYSNVDRDIIIENNMVDSLIDRIYFEKKGLTLPGTDKYTCFNIDNSLQQANSKTVLKGKKIYPNDPCPCGSGKKYKKCHGRK